MDKGQIRGVLLGELVQMNVSWSYHAPDPDKLSDEWLIEKVLLHADLDSIYRLFDLFTEQEIRRVWEKQLLPDISKRSLNLLYAFLLFRIPKPEQYIQAKSG